MCIEFEQMAQTGIDRMNEKNWTLNKSEQSIVKFLKSEIKKKWLWFIWIKKAK